MRLDSAVLRQCWFLAGPTACGKTAVSLRCADEIGAEIVALDSMTLYRGMDIGTAKPTLAERKSVRHHLIDVIDPHEEYCVAEYLRAADEACREILSRGRTPLFVGGSGLYLRSLLRGVFEGPSADWEFRHALEERARREPEGWLYAEVQRTDPETAAKLHPADERRLIRALEIRHLTGNVASAQRREAVLSPEERPTRVYWLSPPRDWLYMRINVRVDQMFREGLVGEVKHLLRQPRGLGRTARQGLGYKEVIAHLEGRLTLDEAREELQTRTRQFAKRQHTWFRNLEECREVAVDSGDTPGSLTARLLQAVANG
jgi:tRNA dimethylallyltransferase